MSGAPNLSGPLRAVLIDLDGSLLETAPDLALAAERLLRARRPPASMALGNDGGVRS
jgi:phosphoglycolate phosphatase-like HAD superfamily hydrolase